MLYKFVEGYTADYTAKNRCIALYTDTHCVTALHSYTATIQLHSAIRYTAIQRYTLYNLYNTPLPSPLCGGSGWNQEYLSITVRR
jgi:hypothetical protein